MTAMSPGSHHCVYLLSLLSLWIGACSPSHTDEDVVEPWVAPPPELQVYEIGYNEAGKTAAHTFTMVETGSVAPIVKGTQGAWMLVIAARCNALPPGKNRVTVEAELGPPGETPYGKLKYKRRPVLDGGDGFRYLMNVFLVVSNNEEWDEQETALTVSIETEDGQKFEQTQMIHLRKQMIE